MTKYLIEVPHDADTLACLQAIKIFLATGSHFLTNADWGCHDGVHKAWITVEAENKEEARLILPAAYRACATITTLDKFSMDEVDEMMRQHTKVEG